MLEFTEKLGWKMQKRDEDPINDFCTKIGVDKGVFKVWMHNNKNTFGKKDITPPLLSNNGINYGGGAAFHHPHHRDIKNHVHGQEMNLHLDNNSSAHALGTNGSSSFSS
ncbi:hypothetical protein ACS0TY_012195 [Phlomoides rotata]